MIDEVSDLLKGKRKGTVKWFSDEKGYGFLAQENDRDIFVHFSSIKEMPGFKTLAEGDEVSFEIENGDRGQVAKKVLLIKGKNPDEF